MKLNEFLNFPKHCWTYEAQHHRKAGNASSIEVTALLNFVIDLIFIFLHLQHNLHIMLESSGETTVQFCREKQHLRLKYNVKKTQNMKEIKCTIFTNKVMENNLYHSILPSQITVISHSSTKVGHKPHYLLTLFSLVYLTDHLHSYITFKCCLKTTHCPATANMIQGSHPKPWDRVLAGISTTGVHSAVGEPRPFPSYALLLLGHPLQSLSVATDIKHTTYPQEVK